MTQRKRSLKKLPGPNFPGLTDPEELIAILRKYHSDTGKPLAAMATEAGLHFNSFNRLDDPEWRPRLDTLRRIYAYLSGAGKIGEPATTLPMSGDGWEIALDSDGWWVIDNTGNAHGAYKSLRSAVSEAQHRFGP